MIYPIFVGCDERTKSYKFLPDGSKTWVPVRTLACEDRVGSGVLVPGVNAVKPVAVKIPGGNLLGEPRWHGEEDGGVGVARPNRMSME